MILIGIDRGCNDADVLYIKRTIDEKRWRAMVGSMRASINAREQLVDKKLGRRSTVLESLSCEPNNTEPITPPWADTTCIARPPSRGNTTKPIRRQPRGGRRGGNSHGEAS
jgi:hypothetical protein